MRIAFVGNGNSGLGSSCLLSRGLEVHLRERQAQLDANGWSFDPEADVRPVPLETWTVVRTPTLRRDSGAMR